MYAGGAGASRRSWSKDRLAARRFAYLVAPCMVMSISGVCEHTRNHEVTNFMVFSVGQRQPKLSMCRSTMSNWALLPVPGALSAVNISFNGGRVWVVRCGERKLYNNVLGGVVDDRLVVLRTAPLATWGLGGVQSCQNSTRIIVGELDF